MPVFLQSISLAAKDRSGNRRQKERWFFSSFLCIWRAGKPVVCSSFYCPEGRGVFSFFGINPEGHPDPRPIILHENWPGNVYPLRKDFDWQYRPPKARASYPFQRVEGEGVYEIPVGPVHAGIIEPGHFRFSVVGEEIVSLEARLGYTHKGIEKLFEVLPFEKKVMLSERVSGDSSFSHSLAYCQAVEKLGDAEVPKKALYLRVIYAELERIANHLGDIGAIMMDTAFAFGGSNGARLREIVMQWNEKLTGSRFLRGVNTVGGVTKDIPSEIKQDFKASLAALEKDFKEVIEIAEGTATLMNRLHGTGSIDRTVALDHGILGVAGKAVGIAQDTRIDFPYAAYKEMPLRMALESSGDVYARFKVRISEVLNSIEIIRHALRTMPNGDICTLSLPRLKKQSFAFSLVEGWRGDIAYFVATDEQGTITRCKVRDTSFLNWAIMGYAVTNDVVPDFPLINKSFNLSYSGNDL
ncbi:MAG: NADH-quinone oxidoreductase subunit C [Candidatus Wildermuthbacteria bacterium]|nr:NADH-quinone oxidoreductase subunit C [Candidatus Wildermuthbacteria bacterium]